MGTTVVIGAGVIGLASAYELLKRGRDVIIIDKGHPGQACSAGNAGWIVPAMSAPIPAPGLMATSLRWMLKRDSPLYIKPQLNPSFARWMWRFWRNCRPAPFHAGLNAVMSLNRSTMLLFDAWRAEGLSFEMHKQGLLFAGLSHAVVSHASHEINMLSPYGYAHVDVLGKSELQDLEPGLSDLVVAGFLLPDERSVRPELLTAALVSAVLEHGGRIASEVSVTGARVVSNEVRAIDTQQGSVECDEVLIAAGAWSGDVSSSLGTPLPIQAGKGYSITVETHASPVSRPVDLIEAKVACTPFDGAFRLAGTMELSGQNLRVERKRVDAVRRAGTRYFRAMNDVGPERVWVGMRPLTPDGLPLIGRIPLLSNAFVATGHAMLGVTLAPVTARAIAECMTGATPSDSLQPFDPSRFASG